MVQPSQCPVRPQLVKPLWQSEHGLGSRGAGHIYRLRVPDVRSQSTAADTSTRDLNMTHQHPLDPATAAEIEIASALIKKSFNGIQLHFKAGGLEEPPKASLQKYLRAEHAGLPLPSMPRLIFLMWYIKRSPRLFEAIVDVTNGKITYQQELPRDFHGPCDRTELNEAAAVVLSDPLVQAEIKRLKIDDSTVVVDPWDYGVDGTETQERHTQVCIHQ